MAISTKVIGIGGAGNKASIRLIEKEIMSEDQVKLLNSTFSDIPADYRHIAIKYSGPDGSGKERDLAGDICLNSIEDGTLDGLEEFIDDNTKLVVIVTSSGGGTGCGSAHIIAKYMLSMGKDVHMFVFTSFESDGRELQNTIEYFQDIPEGVTVEAISNKNFLENTSNIFKAEKAANEEFTERVKILIGKDIVDSDQNMDERDLYKVSTMPGYMIIGKALLNKVKNVEQFNKILNDMIDGDKSLDTEKSMGRLGLIFNISEDTKDNIDFQCTVIKNKLGFPFETFPHVQYDGKDEYIAFIASGMKMPIDEVKEVYEKYKKESERVDKGKDQFYNATAELRGNSEDSMFNTAETVKPKVSKVDFLKGFKNTKVAAPEVDSNKNLNINSNTEKTPFKNLQIKKNQF